MEYITTDPVTGEMIFEDPKTKIEYKVTFDGKTYLHTDANGVKHKWDLENEKWVIFEDSKKEESGSEEESEEDENTTDEQRKERMFRKRKCRPGWTKANYFKDPETGTYYYSYKGTGCLILYCFFFQIYLRAKYL